MLEWTDIQGMNMASIYLIYPLWEIGMQSEVFTEVDGLCVYVCVCMYVCTCVCVCVCGCE